MTDDGRGAGLRERVQQAAVGAPATLRSSPEQLWSRGVGRRRRRAAGALVAATAAVTLVAGVLVGAGGLLGGPGRPEPAGPVSGLLHVPRTSAPPSPWSAGTSVAGPVGLVSTVGVAPRRSADGEVRRSWYAVSADGSRTRFLDLPGARPRDGVSPATLGQVRGATVSPDGTRVAYAQMAWWGRDAGVAAWGVYDTTTGRTQLLRDPAVGTMTLGVEDAQPAYGVFSADSATLLTYYGSRPGALARDKALVAWDLGSGDGTTLEGPGTRYAPRIGSDPEGLVWSRGRRVTRVIPGAAPGRSGIVRAPWEVLDVSFAPSGPATALVSREPDPEAPGRLVPVLRVSRTADLGAGRQVPLEEASEVLGWIDPAVVVVADVEHRAWSVDLHSGSVARIDVDLPVADVSYLGAVGQVESVSVAADAWAGGLVDQTAPPEVADPRLLPRLLALGGGLAGLLAIGGVLWWLPRSLARSRAARQAARG